MKRLALLLALTALFWVGLFCDPVGFWLTDLHTSLTMIPDHDFPTEHGR